VKIKLYFCDTKQIEMNNREKIINLASSLRDNNMPEGSHILLYGSRARGDWNEDSDWDLLLLFNKAKIEESDYASCFDSFTELSWEIGETISPQLYTISEWNNLKHTPFYENVEQDKRILA